MGQYGKTIKIYLSDGSPSGLRHVEIANWSGQALACPRVRISELSSWDESKRPGVYFLLENINSGSRKLAYIGESEDVYSRLIAHDRQKDFWSEVIIFTSKDENLTKGHIKYLESQIVQQSRDADRYELENSNTPTKSNLPRADMSAMEEFIDNIKLVLGSLGHPILQSLESNQPVTSNPQSLLDYDFNFEVNSLKASGRMTDSGFLLKKGSQIAIKSYNSMPGKTKLIKENLLQEGILIKHEDFLMLNEDYLLSSSSYAASIVAGNSRSGPQSWKTINGKTLKEVEESLLSH
ncbi:MAG: GIY-YIG nuclease family protein [Gammaproteobacteria bacterium]|nr:GIY-YIG nuclease family protein [Gammaproteobacteria bacterium]